MGSTNLNSELLSSKLDETLQIITTVNKQFMDSQLTTFICVCIPEFLSLFETERLIQELTKLGIDVHNIVVNLILPNVSKSLGCEHCDKRKEVHRKYLVQIDDLYSDFNVTKIDSQISEVRGIQKLSEFSKLLTKRYANKL
ncbi:hypothetical protein GJ496_006545 [Pomphorhynchus laevis]|nr:hypothetical protein GJ496_006545 [Pomphorhynchus laevis]